MRYPGARSPGRYREPMRRMSAPDAAMYWRSAIMPSDQFVVYCFDAPTRGLHG